VYKLTKSATSGPDINGSLPSGFLTLFEGSSGNRKARRRFWHAIPNTDHIWRTEVSSYSLKDNGKIRGDAKPIPKVHLLLPPTRASVIAIKWSLGAPRRGQLSRSNFLNVESLLVVEPWPWSTLHTPTKVPVTGSCMSYLRFEGECEMYWPENLRK